ncbi:hypothetical protein [Helicobacter sp. 13S00477-4]|uniref:hypothetical protein n=1 Tax=Helicobacter sp. 13S00477-4 TaxID=1905759 RepID=UPI000BA567E5|nr:hypothetical protein [Helicobacter sp. 13S00477-4]PAF52153.1 hypothetical protein BKH44_03360 [Helicobacter sp. 13S00477-4]
MAISPIGNITYINQNSQINSIQQANTLSRVDMVDIINKEFEDKLKDIEETRPAEGTQSLHPDSKGNGSFNEDNADQEKDNSKSQESITNNSKSHHILDIKV